MSIENRPYVISHAQNREDIILSGFFKNTNDGFYVDIGANDPSLDSVTKYFYEKGWNGINVEPINRFYKKLIDARPRDVNLNIGISNKTGTMTFREYGEFHGLSTFSKATYKDYDKLAKQNEQYSDFIERTVAIKTLKQVFTENNVNKINFMKVDVEGYEYEVLEGNDWILFRPQVICIEANHIRKDWRPILANNKYSAVFFDGLNEYYVADEAVHIKNSFSYIDAVLPTPIIDYRVVGIMEHYKNEKLKADARNVELSNQMYAAQHQAYVAQQEIRELSRLRGLTKGLARKINAIVEEAILPIKYRGVFTPVQTASKKIREVEENSPIAVFKSIKDYDESLKSLNPPDHKLRYAALKAHRRVSIRSAKLIGKVAKRAIKKLRGRLE